jgi:hypothetical protein
MCEERERLIGYVYEECDPAERRAVEAHLESCHVCRNEIGGLRGVRHQLLAWEVPEQSPVWRPVPTAAPASVWNAVPAWAMTLAAGLLLMVGAAGGAVTYALMPRSAAPVTASTPLRVEPREGASPDPARLAQLERRLGDLERSATSTRPIAANPTEVANLKRTLDALAGRVDDLDVAVARTAVNTAEVRTDYQRLRNSFVMTSLAGAPAGTPGFGGAR